MAMASATRPFWMASRILILLSISSSSMGGGRPASDWNFSAASLKPSAREKKIGYDEKIMVLFFCPLPPLLCLYLPVTR